MVFERSVFALLDRLRKRPMSTVVLPLSQVEGSHDNEMDDELDNESDWGSDFEESLPNDRDEEEDLYEIVGDMSDRNATNVSCSLMMMIMIMMMMMMMMMIIGDDYDDYDDDHW